MDLVYFQGLFHAYRIPFWSTVTVAKRVIERLVVTIEMMVSFIPLLHSICHFKGLDFYVTNALKIPDSQTIALAIYINTCAATNLEMNIYLYTHT